MTRKSGSAWAFVRGLIKTYWSNELVPPSMHLPDIQGAVWFALADSGRTGPDLLHIPQRAQAAANL